jgi:hypothetical protein
MDTLTPRYVVDEQQVPTDVVLTIEQWQQIVEELHELADIRAYDEAKSQPQESVSLDRLAKELRAGRGS